VPVDQAGGGGRGYALASDSSDVIRPGASQVSLQSVVSNYFYLESRNQLSISQRSETHTLAVEYRRGFGVRHWPRFEVGAQLQIQESDAGVLNGFITSFEDLVHASLRSRLPVPPALGMSITQQGQVMYHASANGAGFGDVSLVAKVALRDGDPTLRRTRVAVRVATNIAGTQMFTAGNFVGGGVSIDRKMFERAALHGDVRGSIPLDRSHWSLPLNRGAMGYSLGPEFKLSRSTSLNLQVEGATTPYRTTGTIGLDANYGDLALGVNHRFTSRRGPVIVQFYARENMNLPFSVRWNTDPDFAIGAKLTLR
jgi:hypothetical protein